MWSFKVIIYFFLPVFMTLCANVYGQSEPNIQHSRTNQATQHINQVFTDQRDGTKYSLIASEDRYWINANLSYKTPDSHCLNDKESNCKSLGRLYSYEEAQNVCPENWKLPDSQDYRKLFIHISTHEDGHETGIFTLPYSWNNVNDNPAGIKLLQNGMMHKKRFRDHGNFNIWLRSENKNQALHIHAYEQKEKRSEDKQLIIFPHTHETKKPIKEKRKFGVRCIIPISEFNKLSFKNG